MKLGDERKILCKVAGQPKPKVVWTKLTEKGKKDIISTSDELVIQVQGRNSTGEFECTAENGIGKALSKRIQIKLIGK